MRKLLFLPLLLVLQVHAHFNFFITEDEMFRLLGIKAEVFYVDKGVVNRYALNFNVMIPAHISDIHFSWQSLVNRSLPYILAVNYDGQEALLPPQMNISSTGVIPTSVQTFRVTFVCTGIKSAEIEVKLHLIVPSYDKMYNETSLIFRRNKICQRGTESVYRNDSIKLDPESLENATGSLYVAVACAVTMITLIVITTSAVCIKNKKVRSQDPHYMSAIYDNNQHVFVSLGSAVRRPSSAGSGSYATIASIQKSPPSPTTYANGNAYRVSYYASSQVGLMSQTGSQETFDTTKRLRDLAVPGQTLVLEDVIEEGIFGRSYRGFYKGEKTVMVKGLKEGASQRQVHLFLTEGMMLYGMEHKNVLTVLGMNTENPKQPLFIYPFIGRGNLKRFLIKCRQREEDQYTLSTQSLVDIAIQIVFGLMYLHSQCLCHKDVATRNCVIGEKLQVKITDTALSRDFFPNDYFCLDDSESRPVKWLALESLIYKQHSTASDVWSFGVLLWELTTLANQPYPEIDPLDMSNHLRNGYRLFQPVGCPDELFAIMAYCWLANPTERPQLSQLLSCLQDFYTALCRYI
ncbi:tyrosine-protein kinase Dnt-like [Coccinella septempunctata]|uniref:tyrosine-protein kinase Dnt-like n=1 Tax=Coccinella septempunctata TaxID=41139 RepID=UPI001D0939ED|nr:tyrosine-protein kinase Dnt-like [Coccinella septempunctata]